MTNPTIKDVAKLANVSIATVSLVIHNHQRIPQETKDKVLKAITKLNYHPSHSARGLVTRKTGNIGFILTEDHFLRTEPFYTQIFIGTELEAHLNEYYILLTTINSDFNADNELPRFILENNIDGLIVAGKVPKPLVDKLNKYKYPIVFIDYQPEVKKYPGVFVDNINGGMLATNHLIQYGHKKIGFIGGDIEHPSIKERLAGYKKAMECAGLKIYERLIESSENYPARANGYHAAAKLFKKNNDVSAIFACNDAMAIGVIQYIKDNGLKVPDNISVIGFDDVVSENSMEPALSTIRVPKMELGIETMKLIAAMIKNKSKINKNTLIPVELIARKSTNRI